MSCKGVFNIFALQYEFDGMKKLVILTFVILCLCSMSFVRRDKDIDDLLSRLEQTINESSRFDKEKIEHISTLRIRLDRTSDFEDRYAITQELIEEFAAYQCDSALYYVNANIVLSEKYNNETGKVNSILSKCDILGHAGLFSEAVSLIHTVNPEQLDTELRQRYYSVAYSIYQYMSENTLGTEYEKIYAGLVSQYCDSALALAKPNTFDYLRLESAKLIEKNEDEKAIEKLDSAAQSYHEGQREYSIIKSTQAYPVSRLNRSSDEAIELLVEAAMGDIRGSIKENMAIRFLAELLYERGEVEYANKFVKKSMEDASFFSARMRSTQVGQMLPLIDKQYDMLQHEAQSRMRIIIYVLVVVAIIFAVGLFLIVRFAHRLSKANEKLQTSNNQVGKLNGELRKASEITKDLNTKLREANKIKEAYLGQFMEMSSRSISSLDHFRKTMYLLQTTGKTEELRKSLKSNVPVTEALKELYVTFDKAFLTIFPSFVERFNSLLRKEERSGIRPGEPFSTEMRIYALLRMGITDNHRIADFLRCSLSTIYTYRSKMKARAINPDTFEDEILSITAIESRPLETEVVEGGGKKTITTFKRLLSTSRSI